MAIVEYLVKSGIARCLTAMYMREDGAKLRINTEKLHYFLIACFIVRCKFLVQ